MTENLHTFGIDQLMVPASAATVAAPGLLGGPRELTSEEMELVSGGSGPGIWGNSQYIYGNRLNPKENVSPTQLAVEQYVVEKIPDIILAYAFSRLF